DGLLEISTNDFGLGSGSDRLDDALDDNFDAIASLFSDETDGVASRLLAYVEQFTSSSGLISSRESAAEDDQDNINDARATLELRMASYESVLRDRYLNLDQTVARLNQTSSALLASLG
ncbi:flagellar filament capping protein FliD, partial [Glaciecola sp.]|nr:flagellar filament capping protein FliD [Glaciecola sp.]